MLLSPKGAALPRRKTNARVIVPLLRSSYYLLFVFTQGFISGFALIPPWAFQECRTYGTHNAPELWDHCPAVQRSHNLDN